MPVERAASSEPPIDAPSLTARNFGWRYAGSRGPAVIDLEFDVAPGDLLLVVGPVGGGRTTIVRALSGIIPHRFRGEWRGRLIVGDRDVEKTPLRRLASDQGLVGQAAPTFLASRVGREIALRLENRGWPPEQTRERVDDALRAFGLDGLAGAPVRELCRGDQQLVALAAALAPRPGLLLLDEPTAHLDRERRAAVLRRLAELAVQRTTTIVVIDQHAGSLLELADRVLLLDEVGRQIYFGPPARVTAGLVARLYRAGAALPDDWQRWMTGTTAARVEQSSNGSHSADHAPSALPGVQHPLLIARGLTVNHATTGAPPLPAADTVRPAVRDIDLELSAGQRTVVFGPNGCGATSLLLALGGLLEPTAGAVLVGDGSAPPMLDPRDAPAERLSQLLGLFFAEPECAFVGRTVTREVSAGSRDPRGDEMLWTELEQVLARFGRLPPEADPYRLSFGEQRLVNMAAVAWNATGVVLLDQPSVGLDRRTAELLMELLDELRALGQAQLIATQDERLVASADNVLALDEGAAVYWGPRAALPSTIGQPLGTLHASGRREPAAWGLPVR